MTQDATRVSASRRATQPDEALTARVLAAMLGETTALMDIVTNAGDAADATDAEQQNQETALVLRLASRLARVGGWLINQEVGAFNADQDRTADGYSAALEPARRTPLDAAMAGGDLAAVAVRVDQLVERAVRLDCLLNGHPPVESRAPARSGAEVQSGSGVLDLSFAGLDHRPASAVILPFKKPTSAEEVDGAPAKQKRVRKARVTAPSAKAGSKGRAKTVAQKRGAGAAASSPDRASAAAAPAGAATAAREPSDPSGSGVE